MAKLRPPADGALPVSITYRPGRVQDSRAVYGVFLSAIDDLGRRQNATAISGGQDPEVLARLWQRRRPLFEHLARNAEHFWVAEVEGESDGSLCRVHPG